jgi:hypothetical protein
MSDAEKQPVRKAEVSTRLGQFSGVARSWNPAGRGRFNFVVLSLLPVVLLLMSVTTAVCEDKPIMTLAMSSCDQLLFHAYTFVPDHSTMEASRSRPSGQDQRATETAKPDFLEWTACSFSLRAEQHNKVDWGNLFLLPRKILRESGRSRTWGGIRAGFGRVFFDKPAFKGWQDPPCGFLKVSFSF